jgi:hypothetical protein
MAWIDTGVEDADLWRVSTDVSKSLEYINGTLAGDGIIIPWTLRMVTTETVETWEADGYIFKVADAWKNDTADPKTTETSVTVGSGIITAQYYYISSDVSETRSISKSSEAGSWKCILTKTTRTTTVTSV